MKIASDEQRELIRALALEVITDSALSDVDALKIVNKSLEVYENILNREELSITEQHGVIVAVLSQMLLENISLRNSLDCQNKG